MICDERPTVIQIAPLCHVIVVAAALRTPARPSNLHHVYPSKTAFENVSYSLITCQVDVQDLFGENIYGAHLLAFAIGPTEIETNNWCIGSGITITRLDTKN